MWHVRYATLLILCVPFVQCAPWNCKVVIGKNTWDLTHLNVEKVVTRTRPSPPSVFEDEVRFNICDQLKEREGYDASDQCPSGTLACLTETNKKSNDGSDRITRVVPLASASTMDIKYMVLESADKGLVLLLHGPSYPPNEPGTVSQRFNLTMRCAKSESEPIFKGYDQVTGILDVDWSLPAACWSGEGSDVPEEDDKKPDSESPSPETSGGSFGWFILLLFLAAGAYLGLGAYYNYSNYGSTGWDLVPHRDFWRDVPYLFQDLIGYFFNSVQSGGSRRGYVSV